MSLGLPDARFYVSNASVVTLTGALPSAYLINPHRIRKIPRRNPLFRRLSEKPLDASPHRWMDFQGVRDLGFGRSFG
jgi:hypothetical protein